MRRLATATLMGLAILVPTAAGAASIRIATGVDASGNTLASGVLDPFWTISVQGGGFASAEVAAPGHPIICCDMDTVGTGANWISDQSISTSNALTGWGVNQLALARRTIDLTGFDPATAVLSGLWRVADNRFGVYINGNLVPTTNDGGNAWFSNQAVNAAGLAFFINGLNTIELRGTSQNTAWDGFYFDVTLRIDEAGSTAVPEPGTLVLLGTGIAAVLARRRFKR